MEIRLEPGALELLEDLGETVGGDPADVAAHIVSSWLGRIRPEDRHLLAERLRRLEAPVRSWPEMERTLMESCLGLA